MHTKKYRASPLALTDKKKSNSVRRRKKNIEQTENLPPPPIKNQMVRPLGLCEPWCERQLSNQNPIFSFSREYVCFDYIIHDRYYDIITETQYHCAEFKMASGKCAFLDLAAC